MSDTEGSSGIGDKGTICSPAPLSESSGPFLQKGVEKEPPQTKQVENESTRLVFIDALRGVAALAVVLFHIYYQNLRLSWAAPFPEPINSVFQYGNFGVNIFFVLSGFVITLSATRSAPSPRSAARFVARRILRLDPPYWVTIGLGIIAIALSNRIFNDRTIALPSFWNTAAHLFYVQHFFGFEDIVPVFWTLAIEVQFYALVVLGVLVDWYWARQNLMKSVQPSFIVFLGLFLFAIAVPSWITKTFSSAVFLYYWPGFFLGMVAYRLMSRQMHWRKATLILAGAIAECLINADPNMLTAILTFVLIVLAISFGGMASWSCGTFLQFLGRVSYSLYLTHTLVGSRIVRLGLRFCNHPIHYPQMAILILVGVIASIITAQLFYILVERPSVKLSRWATTPRRVPGVATLNSQ